ncbi:MAG: hypothetical protein ACOC2Q_02705, partial [Spirochaetota bacterium]
MRRALGLVLMLTALAGSAGAQEMPGPQTALEPREFADEPVPAEVALEALLAARAPLGIRNLTVEDLSAALDLVSLAAQQREHIDRAARLSWAAPGLGHLISGDRGAAFAFAAVDVVVGATTAILASVLLPAAVRSRNLSYLQSSFSAIEERWKSLAPAQLIPSASVVFSGVLLGVTVRSRAAESARRAALQS